MELLNFDNNLLTKSKQEVKELSFLLVDSVKEGQTDPIKAVAFIHKILEICKEVDKNIRPYALEAINHGKHECYELKLSEVKTGSTYDYLGCGDKVYEILLDTLKKAETAVKAREAFLKALPNKMELVNENTGETWTVTPPVNSFKTSLKIEF